MKTIYLDHNIIHYYVKGFPAGWKAEVELAALAQAHGQHPHVRFVVRDWNIVEAARDCAGSPSPPDLAARYAT